ncbi:MAG: 50S ribosomal protein L13 [Polyangiales bacterium]|nr:50S ribosomal protein L13 [Myxococcales bacterium]
MRTLSANPQNIQRNWHVVDASGRSLGRVASLVANLLRGKHRPDYTPHVDSGDFVVVINAEKVKLTGNKENDKQWSRHSRYPGGFKQTPYAVVRQTKPELMIEKAVRGMMSYGPLTRQLRTKLKVYAGPTHPHAAQKPQPFAF